MNVHVNSILFFLLLTVVAGGCKPAEMPVQELPSGPGPELLQACPWEYGLTRSFKALPAQPRELALNPAGAELFVVGDQSLHVLDSRTGELLQQWPLPGAGTAVAVNSANQVLVGVTDKVLHFDTNGNLLKTWDSVRLDDRPRKFRLITGLTVADTDVFVADAGLRRVFRFARDGDFIGEIGAPDKQAGVTGLRLPGPHLSCEVVGENLLAVNNTGLRRVEFYDFNGALQHAWGGPGTGLKEFSGCCNPVSLAGSGGLEPVLAAAEKGLIRVQVFSLKGEILAYIGPESFNRQSPWLALAVKNDAAEIYVLDPAAATVLVFTRRIE